jgi:hypothetical protein
MRIDSIPDSMSMPTLLDRRPAQVLEATAEVPQGQLIDRADGVAFVELAFGRDPDPAGDPFGGAGDRYRDASAPRIGVGAGRRQAAGVGKGVRYYAGGQYSNVSR